MPARTSALGPFLAVALSALIADATNSAATTTLTPLIAVPSISAPPDATSGANELAPFLAIGCWTDGGCEAGGTYATTTGALNLLPMDAGADGGAWTSAQSLAEPAAAAGASAPSGSLAAISCPATRDCFGVGSVVDAHGAVDGLLATYDIGEWTETSTLAASRGGSGPASTDTELSAISCTDLFSCVAGGQYRDHAGEVRAMVVSRQAGRWLRAATLALPAGAANDAARVGAVACTTPGNCIAGGSYSDRAGTSEQQAMLATERGGTWNKAAKVGLPAGATTTPDDQVASVNGIACPTAASCVALGTYTDAAGAVEPMLISQRRGRWQPATTVAVPESAATHASGRLLGIACSQPGACVADGSFVVDSSGDTQPMSIEEAAGRWRPAHAVTPPANRATTSPFSAELNATSCTPLGFCAAAGGYRTAAGGTAPIVATGQIPAAPPTLVAAGRVSRSGVDILIPLKCTGVVGQYCDGSVTLTAPNGQSLGVARYAFPALQSVTYNLPLSRRVVPAQARMTIRQFSPGAQPIRTTVAL